MHCVFIDQEKSVRKTGDNTYLTLLRVSHTYIYVYSIVIC